MYISSSRWNWKQEQELDPESEPDTANTNTTTSLDHSPVRPGQHSLKVGGRCLLFAACCLARGLCKRELSIRGSLFFVLVPGANRSSRSFQRLNAFGASALLRGNTKFHSQTESSTQQITHPPPDFDLCPNPKPPVFIITVSFCLSNEVRSLGVNS